MSHLIRTLGIIFVCAALNQGCSDGDKTPAPDGTSSKTDGGVTTKDGSGGGADSSPSADAISSSKSSLKVAAVQYGSGQFAMVGSCTNDVCALSELIKQAQKNGAEIVATPEYAVEQKTAETSPNKGDDVVNDARFKDGSIIKTFGKLAVQLKVTVIFNLITQVGSGTTAKLYNTQLAVGPAGKVVARHYKFHLFGNENTQLTAGTNVTTNFFDTPAGKVGLLICADIQCIVYGKGPDCPARNLALLQEYTKQNAVATFFSAYWTVGQSNAGSSAWWPLNVQKKFAVDAKQYVIAANTSAGPGQGGGIFKPGGAEIQSSTTGKPAVIYGELPIPKK